MEGTIDVSNDREIERLGANATAQHALAFWNDLSAAARKDSLELDPLWQQPITPYEDETPSELSSTAHHTRTLILTESLSYEEETRFYHRFRSNFSPSSTFPVDCLSSSFLYGEYTRPKWTLLLQATHGQLTDYNFITLLRKNAQDMFWMSETEVCGGSSQNGSPTDTLDELLVVSRAQWLFLELARCREGCYGYSFRRKLEIFDLKTISDELLSHVQKLYKENQEHVLQGDNNTTDLLQNCWKTLALLQKQWPYPTKKALIESGAGKALKWIVYHLPDSYKELKQSVHDTLETWRHLIQVGTILQQEQAIFDRASYKSVDHHFKSLLQSSSKRGGDSPLSNVYHSSSLSIRIPRTTQSLSDLCVFHSKDASKVQATFQTFGLVVLNSDCIPNTIIEKCRTYGSLCLQQFQNNVLSPQGLLVHGDNTFDFHECRQRPGHRVDNRYQILQPHSPILALLESSMIQSLIQTLFGSGVDYKVLYAGIVHSFPSLDNQSPPPAQLWHRDGPGLFSTKDHYHHPTHCFNIFIPLVDVHSGNGCTEFFPGSHCDTIFENYCKEVVDLAEKDPSAQHPFVARPQVKAGSVLAFDIRVMHRGLANVSKEERPLLYFTVARSWWTEQHMFKETTVPNTIPVPSSSLLESELSLNEKMVSSMYKMATGIDILNYLDLDYGHPHYTDRFDLLLLEDLKSNDTDSRLRGKVNIAAVMSFIALTNEAKCDLMIKWVEILQRTHSKKMETLENASALRKQVQAQDFTSITDDLSDVTALYHFLVTNIFSEPSLKSLGFAQDREGLYVLLALFKAQCLGWCRFNFVLPPDSMLMTHQLLEESLTSWWHAGGGRFSWKGPSGQERVKKNILVIFSSLGSGLARPEWGGSIAGMAPVEDSLDVLHVLDPAFSWYQQDPSCEWKGLEYYHNQIKELTSSYHRVMYLGDSMGGAAALLFADLADKVLVFTPQIDISTYDAIKRKDFPSHLRSRFKDIIIDVVKRSSSHIKIHYGAGCEEDVSQINCLTEDIDDSSRISLIPHDYDDHVLSIHLKEKGILKSIIYNEVQEFLNVECNVRSMP